MMPYATEMAPGDAGALARALAAANLPVEDLARPGQRFFGFRDAGGLLIGYGGWEGGDSDLLLRSVVVTAARGQGYGGAIVAALEALAREAGARRLHLLTTSAAPFFLRHDYRVAERATAPASIAMTEQFKTLCPAGAAYLVKSLA